MKIGGNTFIFDYLYQKNQDFLTLLLKNQEKIKKSRPIFPRKSRRSRQVEILIEKAFQISFQHFIVAPLHLRSQIYFGSPCTINRHLSGLRTIKF